MQDKAIEGLEAGHPIYGIYLRNILLPLPAQSNFQRSVNSLRS